MENRNIIRETLLKDLAIHKGLKVNSLFNLILMIHNAGVDEKSTEILPGNYNVSAEAIIITSEKDIDKFIESRSLIEKIEGYKYKHSSVYIAGIKEHIINIYKYKPLGGSSYIELPKEYANKSSGLVNIRNKTICVLNGVILHINSQQQKIKTE